MLCHRTGLYCLACVCAVLATCAVASAQSALDGFDPGANSNARAVVVQPDGKLVVGGDFTMLGGGGTGTTPRTRIGRLHANGSIDASFDPGAGAGGIVYTLAVQPDAKILLGGFFTTLGGETRNRIGRLNANGSPDLAFDPGANDVVRVVAVQPDGKILVGGDFTMLGGGGTGTAPRNRIGRLHANGALDTSFDPGANGIVFAVAVQADGKILVGGSFTTLGGQTRNRIGRLHPDGSLDTSFNPGANATVFALSVQADGKILVGGSLTTLGGGGVGTTTRNRIGRLHADGSLDDDFNPGADNFIFRIAVQPDGKILAGGDFTMLGGGGTGTSPRSRIGRLNADGSPDPVFNPGTNGQVLALAVQPDGKIVACGAFTMLGGGGTGTTTRNYLGRLNAEGSLETHFNPGGGGVQAIAVQPDGKIVVGGVFSILGGQLRDRIGRLNPDGSLDTSFNPGANDAVNGLVLQPDGKILVVGGFTTLGGQTRHRIGRLNPNGSVDLSFDPGANADVIALALQPDGKILLGGTFTGLGGGTGTTTRNYIGRVDSNGVVDMGFDPGADSTVFSLAVQPDDKILVGGLFHNLGGGGTGTTPRNYVGRLSASGALDMSFNPGASGGVSAVAVQPDGKILVVGGFNSLGGGGTGTTTRNNIGRLHADGSLDESFDPGANLGVSVVAVQTDGKILVGGNFTGLGGGTGTTPRNYLGRLHANGLLDASFDPGADNGVFGFAVQPDGKILVGGGFTALGGGGAGTAQRRGIGRLTNTDAAIQELAVTNIGTVVSWSRSGAGPEVSRVTFESSTDGVSYTSLGTVTRVAGGWQWSGGDLAQKQNLFIRARGYYATGFSNASGSIVESVRHAYIQFTDDPVTAGITRIRSVHVTELRVRIDVLRTRHGLGAFAWTDAPLNAGTIVNALHVSQLRTALQEAYVASGQEPPTFSDSPIVPGKSVIKALHITELRDAVYSFDR